jgi:DNA repair exonuclease SbcCD ATPase subunit
MKLRAIEMANVRRFTDRVRIDGIRDGVNVLCAPNECGKSTTFDALQALFFHRHGSRSSEITALRPYAGGAPEVAVDLDLDDGRRFQIRKRWLSRPIAEVRDAAGLLLHQADEAEAWIDRATRGGTTGPSGLLWVRQGLVDLDPPRQRDQAAHQTARRDLMASVAGEVEAMTGGRRMDVALRRCAEALSELVTDTGRPRTGGPYHDVLREIEAIEAESARLRDNLAAFDSEIGERARLRRLHAELTEAEVVAERTARLAAAETAARAAREHAAALQTAEMREGAAAARAAQARRDFDDHRKAAEERDAAHGERDRAARAAAEALARDLAAAEADRAAEARAKAAGSAHQAARDALDDARRAERAAAGQREIADLAARLDRIDAHLRAAQQAAAEVEANPVDAPALDRILALDAALALARARRDAEAMTLTVAYAPGAEGGLRVNGAALAQSGSLPILGRTEIDLACGSRLTLAPGRADAGAGARDHAAAEAALQSALAALGLPDLAAARAAARRRDEAERRVTAADLAAREIAPEGAQALRERIARLRLDVPETEDAPAPARDPADFAALSAAVEAAAAKLTEALHARDLTRAALARSQAELSRSGAALTLAEERLARSDPALADRAARDARDLALAQARDQADAALMEAQGRVAALRADAPDLAAAEATLARARSVIETAAAEQKEIELKLERLTGTIQARASDADAENLAELEGRLAPLTRRRDALQAEIRGLQRLKSALETARASAREQYFAPIAAELRPLLTLLHPDATLELDDATVLPRRLVRNGREEAFDALSGGTREQIAVLTRLAFARLLARDGRATPVILDDALVYSDDERIELMFDALHRQARDVQILALSCRQRAFRALGGAKLSIELVP